MALISTRYANRPVSNLYPLEVTSSHSVPRVASRNSPEQQSTAATPTRPRRATAADVMGTISEWARRIRAPAKDDLAFEPCYCLTEHVMQSCHKCMPAQVTWKVLYATA